METPLIPSLCNELDFTIHITCYHRKSIKGTMNFKMFLAIWISLIEISVEQNIASSITSLQITTAPPPWFSTANPPSPPLRRRSPGRGLLRSKRTVAIPGVKR